MDAGGRRDDLLWLYGHRRFWAHLENIFAPPAKERGGVTCSLRLQTLWAVARDQTLELQSG